MTPNEGLTELLDKMIKDALSVDESYTLKLFSNNYTPISTTTASDFTECAFTNYVAKTLTRSGWGASSIVGGKARSQYNTPQTWTCGSTGGSAYGFYILGATSGKVLSAAKFPTPRTLTNGQTLTVTPYMELPGA